MDVPAGLGDPLELHGVFGLTMNAVRIALTPDQEKQYKSFAGNYVLVEASFKKDRNGGDIYGGYLFQVRRMVKSIYDCPKEYAASPRSSVIVFR